MRPASGTIREIVCLTCSASGPKEVQQHEDELTLSSKPLSGLFWGTRIQENVHCIIKGFSNREAIMGWFTKGQYTRPLTKGQKDGRVLCAACFLDLDGLKYSLCCS